MIVTMLHWLIKELIKSILQMLLLLISWLHFLASALMSIPFLGWHGSASPTDLSAERVTTIWNVFARVWISGIRYSDGYCIIIFVFQLGANFDSEYLSELTEEELDSTASFSVGSQKLRGFLYWDYKYLRPFFIRR